MGLSVFPVAVDSSGGATTQYVTAASSATMYSATIALDPGIYTITCISSTVAYVEFWNSSTYIGKATTYLGSTSYNLATAATKVYYYTNTGSSVSIGIALTGTNVSGSSSGTLYTITANQTFTQTGVGYVILAGGGGGGGGGMNSSQYSSTGGGGGSGGFIDAGYITLTGNLPVVIGGSGSGGAAGGTSGTSGTLTSIAGNSAGGGGGGTGGSGYNSGPGGSAGSPNGGAGGNGMYSFSGPQNSPSAGTVSSIGISTMPMIVAAPGTIGGGGGGGGGSSAGSLEYGRGGNGGGYGGAGGNGTSGIVYILKLT
jgi:hypothetical protein